MDVRVFDYIDDRLAASSDFEALDSLIENAKAQQDLLKKQVCRNRIHITRGKHSLRPNSYTMLDETTTTRRLRPRMMS